MTFDCFKDWNNFQKKNSAGNFYQSLQWAKVHKLKGGKFFLWQKIDKNDVIAQAVILKYDIPFNQNYLYIPNGPIGNIQDVWDDFFVFLKKIALNEKSIFARFYSGDFLHYRSYNVKKPPKDYFLSASNIPPVSARLNLIKDPEELFLAMHEKTRYNIRLAQKKGVLIRNFSHENMLNQLNDFFKLLKKTATKKDFLLHNLNHYEALQKVFKDQLTLFISYYQEKPIATALILKWDNTAYYLHGGTDFSYRNLMSPHLLHWEIIKFCKNLGMDFYDFGAIASKEYQVKKWEGITRFKLNFGAQEYKLNQAYDLVFNPAVYFLYNLARKIL